MLRALSVVPVLAVVSLAVAASPAQAILITVNFSSSIGSGSFSYDDAIVVLGGAVGSLGGSTDLASNISFSGGAGVWDSGNAGVNYLQFDAAGGLIGWQLGGDVNGIGSTGSGGTDFYVRTSPDFGDAFDYRIDQGFLTIGGSGSAAYNTDVVTYTVEQQAAPEPAAWMLLSGALVGLVTVRRRVRK